ncbi:MAG: DUF2442 domain-containing protein [Alphaproteobacteria bacterium]|nr:DUF2442 domain-containing protein [Alphaproteobacteria bacterium]
MSTSNAKIKKIFFRKGIMTVVMPDGLKIRVPIEWYPRLQRATSKQRNNWQVLGRNYGIHWPDIDEDLSIDGLTKGQPSPAYRKPRKTTKSHQPELRA